MVTMEARMSGQAVTMDQLPYAPVPQLLPLFDETSIVLPGPPLYGANPFPEGSTAAYLVEASHSFSGVSVTPLSGVVGTVVTGAGVLALGVLGWWGVQKLRGRPRPRRVRRGSW